VLCCSNSRAWNQVNDFALLSSSLPFTLPRRLDSSLKKAEVLDVGRLPGYLIGKPLPPFTPPTSPTNVPSCLLGDGNNPSPGPRSPRALRRHFTASIFRLELVFSSLYAYRLHTGRPHPVAHHPSPSSESTARKRSLSHPLPSTTAESPPPQSWRCHHRSPPCTHRQFLAPGAIVATCLRRGLCLEHTA
jgi:hypothetical protein